MDIINLILTLIIAILGGYLASKKKVPAAYMLGALFLVALFNICSNKAFLPNYFKFITQIATGTFIGSKFRSEDIKMLKKVIVPGMVMVVLMIAFSFLLSYLMSTFLGIDNLTSFFATAPGGIMDISLIAYDFKANTSQVALLQLIRLISVISFVPFFTKKCYERNIKKSVNSEQEIENKKEKKFEIKSEKSFLFTIIVGIIGGIIGYFSHLPAGTMSCSMALVAYFNVKTHKAYMPLTLRKIIQSFGGALIGAKVTLSDVIALKDLILPIILIVIGFCLMNILVGFFLYKTTKFSLSTALLSASPGGMSDISLMAEDLGANGPQVASMQFLRAIFIVGVYPIIIKILFT
ncbi:AbrB family transcriptional regulator [Fusobacterium hwasookii]|uniref:AbrB family transcriptional regulator n=1 Tax=Fusobacterium hwasookii TaxID=1583098 RepID=UPI001C6ECD29|nr:AbrB family transcriptional regulator [Fusobacterium hwasookii]QYR54725.1 AbrB family transcriptional regulator [Fusobacterium hwasookii]